VNIIEGAVRVVTRSAEATAAAAGAVGGAAVNGVVGGMQGTLNGIKNGVSSGSHSTPAAALTLAAIGAAGLVEWPIVVGVGGTALVVRRLTQRSDGQPAPSLKAVPDSLPQAAAKPVAKRSAARKKTKATNPPARKAAARRRAPAKR
jgi:hypothetical protein